MKNRLKINWLSILVTFFCSSCYGNTSDRNKSNNGDTLKLAARVTQTLYKDTSVVDIERLQDDVVNLLKNSSFEDGNRFWSGSLDLDNNIKRTGKASGVYRTSRPSRNELFVQKIEGVKGGDLLVFSGWMKGNNISTKALNSEKGATIFVQGFNSLGKYIKGEFSVALTGTFDWTYVKGLYSVPEDVSNVRFGFFLRHESTGEVWFDDLSVTKQSAGQTNVKRANISMVESHGSSKEKGSVYIDGRGFTVKDGKRFFPLIIYLGEGPKAGNWANSEDHLERISSTGFNTIMSYYYGSRPDIDYFFSTAQKFNLNVVFNLKDLHDGLQTYRDIEKPALSVANDIVSKFKNEPNLLAWYINDELGLGKYSSIKSMYEMTRSQDGNHPVFQVENRIESLRYLSDLSDVIGTDPYPIVSKNVNSLKMVSDWTDATVSLANQDKKGVWQVIQLVDLSFHNNRDARAPTLKEIKNMCYQAIISGAKGLSFYNYHWLWYGFNKDGKKEFSKIAFTRRWPDIQKLVKELNEITPVVLQDSIVAIDLRGKQTEVKFKCYKEGDNFILMIANPDNVQRDLSIHIPKHFKKGYNSLSRKTKINFSGNEIQLKVAGLESGFVVLEPMSL